MRSTYGLNIVYVRCSPIFSTPRCRYPITHSRPRTFSPSSRRITRSTPCVAGCCGPMLMTSSLASRNGFSWASRSRCESELFRSVISSYWSSYWRFSLPAFNAQVDLHPFVILLQDVVILAQRKSLPAVGQQNPLQIGMSIKLNAEHVVDFALQPVGGRPDGNGTREAFAIQNLRRHTNALVAREGIKHPHHIELLLSLWVMHRRDVNAVIELLFIAENLENLGNQGTIDHHVVLPGVSERIDAGTVCPLELRDHWRIPGSRHGRGWFRRGCRFRSSRRRGRCSGCGFRRHWRRRRRSGLFSGSLCIGLDGARSSCSHAARNGCLIRRRFRLALPRRGRRSEERRGG